MDKAVVVDLLVNMMGLKEPEPEPVDPNFAQQWLEANLTKKQKAERAELRKKQKAVQALLDKVRAKHDQIEKSEKPVIYAGKKAKKLALKELKKDEDKVYMARRKIEIKEKAASSFRSRSMSKSPLRRQRSPSVSEHSSVSSIDT
jgi:hypothetical protein